MSESFAFYTIPKKKKCTYFAFNLAIKHFIVNTIILLLIQ